MLCSELRSLSDLRFDVVLNPKRYSAAMTSDRTGRK